MDLLIEQVVKRKKTTSYYAKIVICILIDILIPTTLFILAFAIPQAYLIYIALFALPFLVWGSWYFITSLTIDYEYDLLGSTFGVAKIIAKRKRKNVIKTELKELKDLFKYDDKEMTKYKFSKVYFVGAEDYSEENYVLCCHNEARGNFAIVASLNEEMLNGMKPYLNHEIRKKVFEKP